MLLLLQNAHVALREKLCYLPNRVTHWFKTGKVRCSCQTISPDPIPFFSAHTDGTMHFSGAMQLKMRSCCLPTCIRDLSIAA
jgi:hypothetical protein